MTAVDRNLLFLGLTFLALIAVAAAFSATVTGFEGSAHIPVIIVIELIVYFIAAMVTNPRATLGMAGGTAVYLTIIRALAALIGGILFHSFLTAPEGTTFASAWGHPAAAIIQGVILLLAGPYVVAVTLPDLLGSQATSALLGQKIIRPGGREGSGGPMETAPAGGFVQVFSYEELAGVLKKSASLAGYLIYSTEGLVVWKDLPVRSDKDVLAARVLQESVSQGRLTREGQMGKPRRVMVETREYLLISTPLSPQFGLLLVFHGKTSMEEALQKGGMLSRTTREFLQWKYSALPLPAAPVSSERVAATP